MTHSTSAAWIWNAPEGIEDASGTWPASFLSATEAAKIHYFNILVDVADVLATLGLYRTNRADDNTGNP